MNTKKDRLEQVYEYVRMKFNIHTKTDFADALKITRPALSAAMNGNEAYLTKNLFMRICGAFPNTFNLDYLLTGEGELLSHEVKKEQQPIDNSSLVNALLARADSQLADKQEIIDGLRREL